MIRLRRFPISAYLCAAILPLIFTACARAQNTIELRVRVMLANDRPPGMRLKVELLSGSGMYVRQEFSDEEGGVLFHAVAAGNYRLHVSGLYVRDTTGDTFTLSPRQGSSFQTISVALSEEAEKAQRSAQPTVSLVDLNVPAKAKKDFERGVAAADDRKFDEAKRWFESAIAAYPAYATAYNQLGIVYMQTGAREQGLAAFEKAVAINDQYPGALVNLAKMRFQQSRMPDAEVLLKKAVAVEPRNVEALALLCNAEFENHEYAEAIQSAAQVHGLPHEQFAIVHFVAGKALEAQKQPSAALVQYSLFVQESPNAPTSARARQAIARLQAEPPGK